jgi:hypothetical protein
VKHCRGSGDQRAISYCRHRYQSWYFCRRCLIPIIWGIQAENKQCCCCSVDARESQMLTWFAWERCTLMRSRSYLKDHRHTSHHWYQLSICVLTWVRVGQQHSNIQPNINSKSTYSTNFLEFCSTTIRHTPQVVQARAARRAQCYGRTTAWGSFGGPNIGYSAWLPPPVWNRTKSVPRSSRILHRKRSPNRHSSLSLH